MDLQPDTCMFLLRMFLLCMILLYAIMSNVVYCMHIVIRTIASYVMIYPDYCLFDVDHMNDDYRY